MKNSISDQTRPIYEELNFSYNKIIYNNSISKIDPKLFKDLKNLTYLDLTENQIEESSPELFKNLISLESLQISYNKITNLDFLHLTLNLKLLNFDYKLFTLFDASLLKYLQNLREMYLSGNSNFNCEKLIQIKPLFEKKNIQIYSWLLEGDNVVGLLCVNKTFS